MGARKTNRYKWKYRNEYFRAYLPVSCALVFPINKANCYYMVKFQTPLVYRASSFSVSPLVIPNSHSQIIQKLGWCIAAGYK